jgi:hypothetical protein
MSAALLTLSVLCMLGGMFILIWSSTGHTNGSWWNSDSKLAVTFTIISSGVICLFIAEQVTLYSYDSDRPENSRSEEGRRLISKGSTGTRSRLSESQNEQSSDRELI